MKSSLIKLSIRFMLVVKVALFVTFLSAFGSLQAQNSINLREAFRQMPDSIVPYLSENNRLDFIDFVDSGMDAVVTNAFNGNSKMTVLTPDSLSIELSKASKLDMMVLPIDGEAIDSCRQVLAVVLTYGAEADQYESSINFYSAKWHKLGHEIPLTAASKRKLEPFGQLTMLKWYDKVINKD